MKKNRLDILKKLGSGFKSPEDYFDTLEKDVLSKLSTNKFPKKEGYTEPENYFETLEATVFDTIKEKEHLRVPDNYFETLEDNVFYKIKKENNNTPRIINLKSRFLKVFAPIAIAASLLLLIMFNYNTTNNTISFDNVATVDIENWIEDDLIAIDAYQITEVFEDTNLEDEFNEDEINVLNYLNGTDIESILITD